jgi:hypothetical protein
MSTITIELIAAVRNPFVNKKRKNQIKIQGNPTIRTVLLENGFKEDELKHLIPILNGNRTTHDDTVQDKDHVWITLPIGGG